MLPLRLDSYYGVPIKLGFFNIIFSAFKKKIRWVQIRFSMKFSIDLNSFCVGVSIWHLFSTHSVKLLSNVIQCQVLLFWCVLPGHVNGKMNLNKEKKNNKNQALKKGEKP